jgi:hypothetical protein
MSDHTASYSTTSTHQLAVGHPRLVSDMKRRPQGLGSNPALADQWCLAIRIGAIHYIVYDSATYHAQGKSYVAFHCVYSALFRDSACFKCGAGFQEHSNKTGTQEYFSIQTALS